MHVARRVLAFEPVPRFQVCVHPARARGHRWYRTSMPLALHTASIQMHQCSKPCQCVFAVWLRWLLDSTPTPTPLPNKLACLHMLRRRLSRAILPASWFLRPQAFVAWGVAANGLGHLLQLDNRVVSDSSEKTLRMSVPSRGVWGTASVQGMNNNPMLQVGGHSPDLHEWCTSREECTLTAAHGLHTANNNTIQPSPRPSVAALHCVRHVPSPMAAPHPRTTVRALQKIKAHVCFCGAELGAHRGVAGTAGRSDQRGCGAAQGVRSVCGCGRGCTVAGACLLPRGAMDGRRGAIDPVAYEGLGCHHLEGVTWKGVDGGRGPNMCICTGVGSKA